MFLLMCQRRVLSAKWIETENKFPLDLTSTEKLSGGCNLMVLVETHFVAWDDFSMGYLHCDEKKKL